MCKTTHAPREAEPASDELTLTGSGRSPRCWQTRAHIGRRFSVGGCAGALHVAVEPIPPQVDAVPAFVAQVAWIAAKAHVYHHLVAHFLDEIDGGYEVAILRDEQGDVVDVEGGIADQVCGDVRIEHLFRRNGDAAG